MRRFVILLVLVVLAFYVGRRLLGEGHSTVDAEAALELVRGEGMARLGYADQAPLAYADATRGLTGEGPEIARAVLERVGVGRVEGVLAQPDRLVRELYARRFEVIAAGLEVTPDGCDQVLFSEPTHAIGEAFLVRTGNPLGLHSYEDAAAKGAYIGVVAGTPQYEYGINAGMQLGRIRVLTSASSGVASLTSGVIDAFAADGLMVQSLVDQTKSAPIERALPFTGPKVDGREVRRYGAFAFRKGDTGLAREFNKYLAEFIGTPEHIALVRRFGITEADLPPKEIRIAELCAATKVASLAKTPADGAAR